MSKSKAKSSSKGEGKKKKNQYQLSPAQDKQLKAVLESYRQAEDAKDTEKVDEILKDMGEKFILQREVEDEEEQVKIKDVSHAHSQHEVANRTGTFVSGG